MKLIFLKHYQYISHVSLHLTDFPINDTLARCQLLVYILRDCIKQFDTLTPSTYKLHEKINRI